MERYDFNTVIERRNTNSIKYDFAVERGKPADVLPLWVADMDFRVPEPVLEALHWAVPAGRIGLSSCNATASFAASGTGRSFSLNST